MSTHIHVYEETKMLKFYKYAIVSHGDCPVHIHSRTYVYMSHRWIVDTSLRKDR